MPGKRLVALVLAVLVAALVPGCGGDKDKGINKERDRPKPVDRDK